MKKINSAQIAKISTLINKLDLTDMKDQIILDITSGRSKSRKDLFFSEAIRLIQYLEGEFEVMNRMVRKIYALGYEVGLLHGSSAEDKKINSYVLDQFCKKRGAVKKAVSKMTKREVLQTLNQFEKMKSNNLNGDLKKFLSELKISTSKS